MGIEQANNWRAKRTNSIKLRTSDRQRHEVVVSQGAAETDPVKIAEMQERREAAKQAVLARQEAAEAARQRAAREARADIEHAMRKDAKQKQRKNQRRRAAPRKSDEVRLAEGVERLRKKFQ